MRTQNRALVIFLLNVFIIKTGAVNEALGVKENPRYAQGGQPREFLLSQQNNNNNENLVCKPQSAPPARESGCCGVDMSGVIGVASLEQYIEFRNQRAKRDADMNKLDVTFEDRIAGGEKSNLDQYPWTAHLRSEFANKFEISIITCGGSLISSRFVLTAAHCLVNGANELRSVTVTLAEYDVRTFPRDCVVVNDGTQLCVDNLAFDVEIVVVHPNFIEEYLINDIALLKLREIAPYSRSIRPICLPPIDIDSSRFALLPLATAGWGLNVSVESDVKQFTTLQLVPKNKCSAYYSRLTEGHLCASGVKNEDTCKGDSGGPLMMLHRGTYYLMGIVSGKTTAFQCGTPVPSLFTNVYPYLDWINYHVQQSNAIV